MAQHTRRVIVGTVCGPTGLPVKGAVVVTDKGGSAVCAADGHFRLVIEVPTDHASLRLSAFGDGGSSGGTGSRRITLSAGTMLTDAGVLTLSTELVCEPEWLPTFGGQPGTDGDIMDVLVFDDGSGPCLYLGGTFSSAGGTIARGVARWDGTSWTQLGGGLDGNVATLAIHDDGRGGGRALYAGGSFQMADGQPAGQVARWDGSTWSPLGAGLQGGSVRDLCSYDDGTGSKLFAGGYFATAGGASVPYLACWIGAQWLPVGDEVDNGVRALHVWNDGSGAKLYAGGDFLNAGGMSANRIAAWDGEVWSTLSASLTWGRVEIMSTHDDGGGAGPLLWVGGIINGSTTADYLVAWDGTDWIPMPSDPGGGVTALYSWHGPVGEPWLVVSGQFSSPSGKLIKAWDGTSWIPFDLGIDKSANAVLAYDFEDGAGEQLVVAGALSVLDKFPNKDVAAHHIALWDGTAWNAVSTGLGNIIATYVNAAAVFDDGTGPALYIGGRFSTAGGMSVLQIAKWNGTQWADVGGGLWTPSSINHVVDDMLVHDDGTTGGPVLYVTGYFTKAGGAPGGINVASIARWDGVTWAPVGSGYGGGVDLEVWDDGLGGGPKLYMGGSFGDTGLVYWDGVTWNEIPITPSGSGTVRSMAVYDDGVSEALYCGGDLTYAGSFMVDGIARWDGVAWSSLGPAGSGPDEDVYVVTVVDVGEGPRLFVGGGFSFPGNNVAMWDGSSWSALGSGVAGTVHSLGGFDAGNGLGGKLYTGGVFTTAGGVPAKGLARWDGTAWSDVAAFGDYKPLCFVEYDIGDGPRLLMGGDFEASPAADSFVACLGVPGSNSPWCSVGLGLSGTLGIPWLSGSGSLLAGSTNQLTLSNAAPGALTGLFIGSSGAPIPFKGGVIVPAPLQQPLLLSTNLAGSTALSFVMPHVVPSGAELWIQAAIIDSASVKGVALSNTVVGTAP